MGLQNVCQEIQYCTISVLLYYFNSLRKIYSHQDHVQNLTLTQVNCRSYYSRKYFYEQQKTIKKEYFSEVLAS